MLLRFAPCLPIYSVKGVQPDAYFLKAYAQYDPQENSIDPQNLYSLASSIYAIDSNSKIAFEIVTKTDELGLKKASLTLYYKYNNGKGTLKDLKKALEYLNKAANYDIEEAQLMLGEKLCYGIKDILPQDLRRASIYLQKAYQSSNIRISNRAQELWNEFNLWVYQ